MREEEQRTVSDPGDRGNSVTMRAVQRLLLVVSAAAGLIGLYGFGLLGCEPGGGCQAGRSTFRWLQVGIVAVALLAVVASFADSMSTRGAYLIGMAAVLLLSWGLLWLWALATWL